MNTNLRTVGIALMAFLILIVFTSCTPTGNNGEVNQTISQESKNPGDVNTVNEAVKLPSLEKTISALPDKFLGNEEFKMCAQSNIDMCMQQVSYTETVTVTCDDYLLEENRISCQNTETRNLAKESGDKSVCDTLGDNKDTCVFEVVTQKAIEAQDERMCEELSDNYLISCNNRVVQLKAVETGNVNICDSIIGLPDTDTQAMEISFCKEEVGMMIEMKQQEEERAAEVQGAVLENQ